MIDPARLKQMTALRDLIRDHRPTTKTAATDRTTARSARPKRGSARSLGRPISFNDEMVRSLLIGRKSQTRRIVNATIARSRKMKGVTRLFDASGEEITCPLGSAGDTLWVRERWAVDEKDRYRYAADAAGSSHRWRPTFHMPRAACRLMLKIKSVRAERLTSITPADARAEGFDRSSHPGPAVEWFRALWDRLFRKPGTRWDDDPWVWVIQFERIEPGE